MAGNTRKRGSKATALSRSQIARAIFSAAESMGISDRALLEQITEGAIRRLEGSQPLPGMEHLVPNFAPSAGNLISETKIRSIIEEIMGEKKKQPQLPQSGGGQPAAPALQAAPAPKTGVIVKVEAKVTTASVAASDEIALSANALTVLERRYLKKDEQGKPIETAADMFRRVARSIAAAEQTYNAGAPVEACEEEFYRLMVGLDFLPNSPTLMNAGRELGQLSACFVLPIEDSMEAIFDAVKYTALIHKSGGGTGFSFSRLRPEKDRVGSTGGVASGPVSFMRAFDTATDVIKQGGMRRGANMAILNVDHPDIRKFITAKEDPHAFNNFNLSVAATDEFMKAVKEGTDYNLINPHDRKVVGKLNAREVFNLIVHKAWEGGDPGIVFIDRINRDNPTPRLGSIESTNPCGEQPLLPYESCNLGSINLSHMLKERDGKVEIDFDRLGRVVKMAVRFLDDVIDVNKFPLPQIEKMTKQTRKIGLGVMGFADMLLHLGIRYDSEAALKVAGEVMGCIQDTASQASRELAQERVEFPAFRGSVYDRPDGYKVRNATRTTIAPTGTLSIIANCSSGIEPLFALAYTRNILDNDSLPEVNPYFEEVAKREGFYSEAMVRELAGGASLRDMKNVPDWVKDLFVTAHDIAPEAHVRMQAAFQSQTNNAVSKTVNFPHDATKEDVARVYLLAYGEGCKGITIYRDRSREHQVLSLEPKKETAKVEVARGTTPRKRSKVTTGMTQRVTTGCGNIYVTVNSDEHGVCEVFSSLGKAGGCASAQLEAACRLISLALRAGVDAHAVVKHLQGIRCPAIAWEDGRAVLSCPDAIGGVLAARLNGKVAAAGGVLSSSKDHAVESEAIGETDEPVNLAGQCPDCGGMLVFQEGCQICRTCGYTRCG